MELTTAFFRRVVHAVVEGMVDDRDEGCDENDSTMLIGQRHATENVHRSARGKGENGVGQNQSIPETGNQRYGERPLGRTEQHCVGSRCIQIACCQPHLHCERIVQHRRPVLANQRHDELVVVQGGDVSDPNGQLGHRRVGSTHENPQLLNPRFARERRRGDHRVGRLSA